MSGTITYKALVSTADGTGLEDKRAHKLSFKDEFGYIHLGLQKVRGGYECVHLATGLCIRELDAKSFFGKPVSLVEARSGVVDHLSVQPELAAAIRKAVEGLEVHNPEYVS